MGIIVVCNLVVDLQPHILENYVRVEDILELDSLALDAVQNVVMTELNSIEDVLVDLFGGQPSSSGSDLLTYLYYPSIKEESAKCSVLTKPGDVSAPGLAWMLSNIPSDLLEKIKEDLEDRPIVGASSLKEVVGYHYFIILFLYLSLMLESEHCKVAVFVKLINIVKAYERIYPLHSSSSSSLSVNGDHVLQIACEGLPVTMAKFLEDQNDLELCLNLGLLARRSNESLMHGGDEGDGEAKDEGTWIIPHCVTSLILCHPSYTSKEVGDVSSNSHCGNPLLQSILSYLQGERDHNDETNRLFFQLACDYERRLLEDDTMLHTSSVELTVDMGLLLLSNPVELCLFNTIYEKLLLAYGVSKIISLSAKQYDKLGVLIQEMESLISHRLTSPPPSDDVVESITKQCEKDIPLSMEGEEGSGNRGGGMMAADEETLFGELIALPSPHLTSSKHRHSFHRSLSTTPSATIPVYMEANLNYLLTMMKLVRSMKKSTIATAAVGSHNNEIEVMMEDLQDGVMMAFLTFLQTTSPSQLPSSSSSYSSSSEEKEEDKINDNKEEQVVYNMMIMKGKLCKLCIR
eukprot:scaffold667_cov168-Ochromonas_danica.AAC.20